MSWLLYFIVPMIIGLAVQGWLRSTFSQNTRVPTQSGLTGAEIARAILDRNGLHDVPVHKSRGGELSDHYDPRKRTVNLSDVVYSGRSVSATAVAAHEVGHALQHATAYVPMQARSAIFPVVAFASQIWMLFLFGGFLLQMIGLIYVAIGLYAFAVIFQIVTLPVEFNASRRAALQLQEAGLANATEGTGVRKVLTAAAMTYVAAALAAIAQLLFFLSLAGGSRD
jgi:Zn-dependent membrane protease YugP